MLPRPFLELYTPLPVRSCVAPLGPGAVGEVGAWALERRVCPLEAGWASLPWLLPMARVKVERCGGTATGDGSRRASYGGGGGCPNS